MIIALLICVCEVFAELFQKATLSSIRVYLLCGVALFLALPSRADLVVIEGGVPEGYRREFLGVVSYNIVDIGEEHFCCQDVSLGI